MQPLAACAPPPAPTQASAAPRTAPSASALVILYVAVTHTVLAEGLNEVSQHKQHHLGTALAEVGEFVGR